MTQGEVDYKAGVEYWITQPATVDGMLGGYGNGRVPRLDIQHSRQCLRQLIDAGTLPAQSPRTVDCGAGIGRVTRDLLSDFSSIVDIVEPCAAFTATIKGLDKVGDIMTIGLQDFEPAAETYTIIWNQWCLGQLTSEDLTAYLRRCKSALTSDGLIFVKENLSSSGTDIFDSQDSSWTRTESSFLKIFKAAGLSVVKSSLQHGFPRELFKVKLWALR